jgi:hypothetical protein
MEYFKNDIYGKIVKPSSFAELIDIIIKEVPNSRNIRYWRGQSDISWRIDSSGYRRLRNTKVHGDNYNRHLKEYEKKLLEQATHRGYRFFAGRELYDFELLGRLQHHGAATRLVDFSKNALIALWFCVIENIEKDGLLIGVCTDYVIGHENKLLNENYENIILKCEGNKDLHTWEPPNVSARMAAQHSQFLYSEVSDLKTGSLLLPKEKDGTTFIAIDSSLKRRFKEILEGSFDFWTISLFPDIDGFGIANNYKISRWDMDRW